MMNKRPTPIKVSSPSSRGDTGLEFGGLWKSRERCTFSSSFLDEYMRKISLAVWMSDALKVFYESGGTIVMIKISNWMRGV